MNKKDLRFEFKLRRTNLTIPTISDYNLLIANNALKLPIWNFDYYHIYLSIAEHNEPDTSDILTILQGKDKNVLVPKVDGDTLKHFLLTDGTRFVKNKWNIPEPHEGIELSESIIDVVFIPLLAFDKKGNRVGYGKGFYDKFLGNCKPDVIKVGLSFFLPVDLISDVSPFDIPLDYCITPTEVFTFR